MFATVVIVSFLAFLCLPLAMSARPGTMIPIRIIWAAFRRQVTVFTPYGRTLTPLQAARAVAAGDLDEAVAAEHRISLYCRECGGPSPTMRADQTALMALGRGFAITAVCRACSHPLISRVVGHDDRGHLLALGVVDADAAVLEFDQLLADL